MPQGLVAKPDGVPPLLALGSPSGDVSSSQLAAAATAMAPRATSIRVNLVFMSHPFLVGGCFRPNVHDAREKVNR
jgi:hypothetical protein